MQQHATGKDSPPTIQNPAGELWTIRQMSRRYSITLRALRFYEDRGLLKPHRIGATRLYDQVAKTRLETILEGKRLGFTLTEISTMLSESKGHPNECRLDLDEKQILQQIDMLERQRAGLDRAIDELKTVQSKLAHRRGTESHAASAA